MKQGKQKVQVVCHPGLDPRNFYVLQYKIIFPSSSLDQGASPRQQLFRNSQV